VTPREKRQASRTQVGATPDAIERLARGRGALLLVAAVAVVAQAFAFDARLNTNGDNAQYLILGESIRTGRGLSHVNSPSEESHTKYPFLYPLVLAGVLAVFPDGLVPAKLFSVACGVGSALLVLLLLRRRGRPRLALAVALVTAVSPHVLEYSRITLAEVPYLFVSLATLLALERALERTPARAGLLVLCVAGIMASYYTKSVGLALAGAAPLAFALRRRWRVALLLALAFAALSFPWYLRNKTVGQENLYLDYFLMRNPYLEGSGQITLAEFGQRVWANVVKYERYFIPNGFVPQAFSYGAQAGAIEPLVAVLLLGLVATGLAVALRAGHRVTEIYTIAFLVMIHAWPDVWSGTRFFLPVLPLLIGYAALGVERAWSAVARRAGGETVAVAAVLLLGAANVAATAQEVQARGPYSPDWANFFAAAEWIRSNTPPDAIVASRSSYVLYWKTRRQTVGYRFVEDPDAVYEDLLRSGARYVLVDSFAWTGTTGRYLVPALNKYRDRFHVAWQADGPPTYVLEILPEGAATP
jgi:hypothetical protein